MPTRPARRQARLRLPKRLRRLQAKSAQRWIGAGQHAHACRDDRRERERERHVAPLGTDAGEVGGVEEHPAPGDAQGEPDAGLERRLGLASPGASGW